MRNLRRSMILAGARIRRKQGDGESTVVKREREMTLVDILDFPTANVVADPHSHIFVVASRSQNRLGTLRVDHRADENDRRLRRRLRGLRLFYANDRRRLRRRGPTTWREKRSFKRGGKRLKQLFREGIFDRRALLVGRFRTVLGAAYHSARQKHGCCERGAYKRLSNVPKI
jgi:hypothetical protein